ncbi:MAG TPA: metal-sensitive transcriptional regulator [Ktedonobacterales bacterium]
MLPTTGLDATTRNALVTRLKSIEGQARGIQHMLEDGRDCQDILDQLAALRAATHATSMQALEAFALHCLRESADAPDKVMTQFVGAVAKLTR